MMYLRVPRILLSATMLKSDVKVCTELLGGMKPNVLHGELSRRNIRSRVFISGNAGSSLRKSARLDFEGSPHVLRGVHMYSTYGTPICAQKQREHCVTWQKIYWR